MKIKFNQLIKYNYNIFFNLKKMFNNSSEEEDKQLIVFVYIINVISITTCIILMISYIPNKTKHTFPLDISMFLLISCLILNLVSFYIPKNEYNINFCIIQAYIVSFTSMINPMICSFISSVIYLNIIFGELIKKIKFYIKLIFILIVIFVNGTYFIIASFNTNIFGKVGLVCEIKNDDEFKIYFWVYFIIIFIFLGLNIIFVILTLISILYHFGITGLNHYKQLFLYALFPLFIYIFNCLSRTIWKGKDFEKYYILFINSMGFFFSLVYGVKDVIRNQFSAKKKVKEHLIDETVSDVNTFNSNYSNSN